MVHSCYVKNKKVLRIYLFYFQVNKVINNNLDNKMSEGYSFSNMSCKGGECNEGSGDDMAFSTVL